jgi:hypothetical protein
MASGMSQSHNHTQHIGEPNHQETEVKTIDVFSGPQFIQSPNVLVIILYQVFCLRGHTNPSGICSLSLAPYGTA